MEHLYILEQKRGVTFKGDGSTRCGLFIALDNIMSNVSNASDQGIAHCVHRLREDRMGVVPSFEHYRYLHSLLYEVCISADKIQERNKNAGEVDNTFNPTNSFNKRACANHHFLYPDHTRDLHVTCVPLEHNTVKKLSEQRAFRLRHSISLQENKLLLGISGVLPSHCQRSFLVPTPTLTVDEQDSNLWQLVFDTGSRTVVTLLPDGLDGSRKRTIFPLYTEDFYLEVKTRLVLHEIIEELTLSLRATKVEPWSPLDEDIAPETTIKMFTVPWSHDLTECHMTSEVFLFELINRWLDQTKTSVVSVHCGNNISVSGHFCAAFNLLCTLCSQGEASVHTVARGVQCCLPQAVTKEEFEHLQRLKDTYIRSRTQTNK